MQAVDFFRFSVKDLGKEAHKAAIDAFLKTVYNPEEWKLMETGVSHACYHYPGSAKIMARIGKGFADALIQLQPRRKTGHGNPRLSTG